MPEAADVIGGEGRAGARLAGPLQALGIERVLLTTATLLFAATVLGQGLNFAVQVVVARAVGIASYGLYSWAFTWISLLALVAGLGVDRLLTRFVAEYRARGEAGRLHALLRWSAGLCLGLSVGVAAGFVALGLALSPAAGAEWRGALVIAALTLPLMVAAVGVESVLRASDAHAMATYPNRLLRPLLLGLLFLGAVAVPGVAADARLALGCNALAMLLTLLVCLPALRRCLPAPAAPVAAPRRQWLAAATAMGLNTVALQLNIQLDMLILGMFHGEAALGTYGAVARIVTVMGFPSTAVIMVIQPMIVRSWQTGSRAELQRLVAGGAWLVALTSWGLALVVLILAEPLLGLFGEAFREGATALRLLTVGYMGASLVSLSSALLTMTGHQNASTAVMLAGTALTAMLCLALVPRWGTVGAATATATSWLAWNLGLLVMARRRVGVTAAPLARPGA